MRISSKMKLFILLCPILIAGYVYKGATTGQTANHQNLTSAVERTEAPVARDAATAREWRVYRNVQYGYELMYPSDARLNADADGQHTTISLPFTPGTNLQEKYVLVSVGQGRDGCANPLSDGYMPETMQSEDLLLNGIRFQKQSGAKGVGDSWYEWVSYSTMKGQQCVNVDFVLHSTNLGSYYPTPPLEFDRDKETMIFQAILLTIRWL